MMVANTRVLGLSSSGLVYGEPGKSNSVLTLLERSLRQAVPEVEWVCSADLLYITADMAERADRAVQKHVPDLVILRPTGQAFLHDDVVSRIRDRWPRLYRLSLRVADTLRALSGGKRYGGSGPRSFIFRIPRRIAITLIGVAPRVPVERAAEYVQEALEVLLKREELAVICQVSVGNVPNELTPAENARRSRYFIQTLRSYCERRLIPFSDAADAFKSPYVLEPDEYHATVDLREAEAEQIAAQVLRALGLHVGAAASGR